MIPSRVSTSHPGLASVGIPALSSITRAQMDAGASGFGSHGDAWVVDCHADYDGYASMVVTHAPTGTTFSLSGTSSRIEVSQLHDDKLQVLGCFDRMEAAIAFLVSELVP